jgi:predicted Mrr-cat superfamily restriction endonuclease
MARYWVIRSDKTHPEFFWSELQAGRLRQGWGYQDDQDLRMIARAADTGRRLNQDQTNTWRGNRRLLETQPDSVQKDDIIISPHLPEYGVWSVSRVTGPYEYAIDRRLKDFGHIRPVELLTKRPVNPQEEAVSALLRQTMRNMMRMWNIDALGPEVEGILRALEKGTPSGAVNLEKRMMMILEQLEGAAWKSVAHHFQGPELEKPCVTVLKRIFGEENVERTAGSGERGADAICTYKDPLGIEHRIAVQIKMWDLETAWTRPLEQIREAYNSYDGITSAVIISTTDGASEDFEKARRALENEIHIPVRMIFKKELLRLLITHLPNVVSSIE